MRTPISPKMKVIASISLPQTIKAKNISYVVYIPTLDALLPTVKLLISQYNWRMTKDKPAELRIIAHNVRKHRKALNKTQEELAGETGLDRTFLSDVENHRVDLRISSLAKIARALKIKLSDLFSEEI